MLVLGVYLVEARRVKKRHFLLRAVESTNDRSEYQPSILFASSRTCGWGKIKCTMFKESRENYDVELIHRFFRGGCVMYYILHFDRCEAKMLLNVHLVKKHEFRHH